MKLMIKRISRQYIIIIIPLSVISFFLTGSDWRFSFSVLLGGGISLVSFRTIIWAVEKFMGQEMAQPIIMGLSIFKVLLIFSLLVVLAIFKLINIVGVLIGFTLVLAIVTREYFLYAKREH